ncbi:hypothetical protein [Billgrantia endophytica]|uniref:Uncharacterized protein n=1 Tax=Billgrantia endophytica TaxID=2033802 RepID=A0A2N7TXY6_9GAMM|nr:hypothetical protein [Halomonas endophytica]PMR73042.1 hypothetical protein C1H69_18860 [Halomonas endophytica]
MLKINGFIKIKDINFIKKIARLVGEQMKRVEFIGANGVGKTTTMRYILSSRGASPYLMDMNQGRTAVARMGLSQLAPIKRFAKRTEFLLASRRKRRVKQLRDKHVGTVLARNPDGIVPFVNCALTVISESDLLVHEKKNQTAWLFDTLYDALYLDDADLANAALCDEAISLKTLMVAMLAGPRETTRLFQLMPLPDMLVFVHGAEEAIYERLIHRERDQPYSHIHYLKDRGRHAVMAQLAQLNEIAAEGCGILEERGCRVVRLNVDQLNLSQQAEALQSPLDELKGKANPVSV